MRYFVTGFGPFHDVQDNPSAILARRTASVLRAPFRILRVSYSAVDEFFASGEANGYDALVMLGFAARDTITPELSAKNQSGVNADVDGIIKAGPIEPGGPEKRLSTLWTAQTDLPHGVRFSDDAGGYLCNYALYRALQDGSIPKAGFVHVPSFDTISQQEQLFALLKLLR